MHICAPARRFRGNKQTKFSILNLIIQLYTICQQQIVSPRHVSILRSPLNWLNEERLAKPPVGLMKRLNQSKLTASPPIRQQLAQALLDFNQIRWFWNQQVNTGKVAGRIAGVHHNRGSWRAQLDGV